MESKSLQLFNWLVCSARRVLRAGLEATLPCGALVLPMVLSRRVRWEGRKMDVSRR